MIFIDGIALTQRHEYARPLAGLRRISYRQPGDINRQGDAVIDDEVCGERAFYAWIQGSHQTALQVLSEEGFVGLRGNPGRFGRADNVFCLDLPGTIERTNEILYSLGLPPFTPGQPFAPLNDTPEIRFDGARVWTIHLTQNFVTGSPENAQHVLNWLDTQSVARVKKSRLGNTTVAWGSLKYCQVEAYIKAPEMLAHAKSDAHREEIKASPVYQWAHSNGIVRIEVKAAKDYLKHKGLTYLGGWNMATVEHIFRERTEILNRCRLDIEEFRPEHLPIRVRTTAAAWLQGVDVRSLMSRATFFRHAAALRQYGIDIAEPRNVAKFPVRVRTIDIHPAQVPDWYRWAA